MKQNNLINLKSGLMRLNAIYGLSMEINQYLELASIALEKIGNVRLKYILINNIELDENNEIDLPCDVKFIEALTECTFNCCSLFYNNYYNYNNYFFYSYIKRSYTNDLDSKGNFVPYHIDIERNKIVIEATQVRKVNLLYGVELLDDEGLPFITEAEADAIANYCVYTDLTKKMLKGDKTVGNMYAEFEKKWSRSLSHARVPRYLNQNETDVILQIQTSFNNKSYGSPFRRSKD